MAVRAAGGLGVVRRDAVAAVQGRLVGHPAVLRLARQPVTGAEPPAVGLGFVGVDLDRPGER